MGSTFVPQFLIGAGKDPISLFCPECGSKNEKGQAFCRNCGALLGKFLCDKRYQIKEAIGKGLDMSLGQGLRLEADLSFLLQSTKDRDEGISAFLEKRTAQFKGE